MIVMTLRNRLNLLQNNHNEFKRNIKLNEKVQCHLLSRCPPGKANKSIQTLIYQFSAWKIHLHFRLPSNRTQNYRLRKEFLRKMVPVPPVLIPVNSTNCEILAPRLLISLSSPSRRLAIPWAVADAARTAQLDRWSGCACTDFWEAMRPVRVLLAAQVRLDLLTSLRKAPEPTIPVGWKAGLCCWETRG